MNVPFSLLAPIGFLAALSLVGIILLHMRRQTPPARGFPSLRFWTASPPETSERTRLRRPPLSALLLAQLLAAALITLALARPATEGVLGFFSSRTTPIHQVIVLDGSTSMLAADPLDRERTRFAEATDEALRNIDDWQPGDVVTVMLVGTRHQTWSASDRQQIDDLRGRIEGLQPAGGEASLNDALRLAGDLLLPDREHRVVVVTDGALTVDPAVAGNVDAPITLRQVGADATTDNLAITSIVARPSAERSDQFRLAFTLAHFGSDPVTVPYSVTADGIEVVADAATLGAQDQRQIEVDLPVGANEVAAGLRADDALSVDNRAILRLAGDDLAQRQILLLSDNPGALLRALETLPGARVDVMPGATPGIKALAPAYDLVVFEGISPMENDVPDVPMILLQPQPFPEGRFAIEGSLTSPRAELAATGDAVLREVDFSGVTFETMPRYVLAEGEQQIASARDDSGGGPLIWRGTFGQTPYLALAFIADATNLPNRVAFPILVANMVGSLTTTPLPSSVALGASVPIIPGNDVSSLEVTVPGGRVVTMNVPEGDGLAGTLAFSETNEAGVYRVVEKRSSGEDAASGVFVVNAGHRQESNLAPNPDLASLLEGGAQADAGGASQEGVLQELWPLIVGAVVAVIGAEWFLRLRQDRRRVAATVTTRRATP
jgi:Ca-activated chloride channel homolog